MSPVASDGGSGFSAEMEKRLFLAHFPTARPPFLLLHSLVRPSVLRTGALNVGNLEFSRGNSRRPMVCAWVMCGVRSLRNEIVKFECILEDGVKNVRLEVLRRC